MVTQFPIAKEKQDKLLRPDFDNLQNNLTQMEKMAAIGQLSSSVAHEMRNLLGMIRTAAFNIDRAAHSSDPTIQNNLEIINRNVARAREFIDNLLNLSRVSNGNTEVVNLCNVVDNLLTLFSKELEWREIVLKKNYRHLPLYRIDRNAIQECFLNLILNAIQSMDRGGSITVDVEDYHQGVRITVTDTGCGISPEDLDIIFDQFYTTKKNGQGTGLGLTIARSIARDLGGDVQVRSRKGVGSSFMICLPRLVSVPDQPEPTTEELTGSRERKTG
ncbi:MAG: sensor histidine kinase [Candidatus Omnitrophota bacterium]|jgi:signal transduction histidine kinase|nr:MAG: sensor histidine kinase [Candidatus Omnitrophota bacterium]